MARTGDGWLNPLLRKILENKREEVASAKRELPPAELKARLADAEPARGFAEPILQCASKHKIIAEIKRESPGTGFRREDFNPVEIGGGYQNAGAAAISVLTDEKFFGGSSKILRQVRAELSLPVLRKDFILSAYQVHEARYIGADAVLLMAVNFDSPAEIADLAGIAGELGLEVLLEIHDEEELSFIPQKPVCVGINNRDFKSDDLKVDIETTRKLAPLIEKSKLLVSESGISDAETMTELEKLGVDAFLIGNALMRTPDPALTLKKLLR